MENPSRELAGEANLTHPLLTIQYLEDSPEVSQLDIKFVIERLRRASGQLPFSHLLIGWNVPEPLLEACRREAEHLGMRFLRWQPLLTSDNRTLPDSNQLTVGMTGQRLLGFRGQPDFTFSCPNHPGVQEAIGNHLAGLLDQGVYQGFFLDRVRFPAPLIDPIHELACFCEHCQHKAGRLGLDLEQVRADILRQSESEAGRLSLVKALFSGTSSPGSPGPQAAITQLLDFRQRSVVDFLLKITQPLRTAHLEIGLDVFSPCLTSMVGQDLARMSPLADWVKLMTYAHARGPAGLPFELSAISRYLQSNTHLSEADTCQWISEATGLPLPSSLDRLSKEGLSSLALEKEIRAGVQACSTPALAGMELVELEGVAQLNTEQIRSDLAAIKRAGPAGLAISWDLLHIPLERLDQVKQVYLQDKSGNQGLVE